MEALRAARNIAEALRAYEDLRTLLREELGTRPARASSRSTSSCCAPSEDPRRPPPAARRRRAAPPRAATAASSSATRARRCSARCVDDARPGEGRVALIEGPAGIGKTRLLTEPRDRRAEAAGARVLSTRAGSELEREFPFGVVRQLFEAALADPARRERALAGAAAPAQAVFERRATRATRAGDASFAALHGLFWLTLNLAAERPLVLARRRPALGRPRRRCASSPTSRAASRALPILSRRPCAPASRPTDPALLDEIASDPATVARPAGPAQRGGRRGARPRAPRRRRRRRVLPRLPPRDGRQPAAAAPAPRPRSRPTTSRPTRRTPTSCARSARAPSPRSVLLRLERLPRRGAAVARAVAVLGENAELPAIAALAGLDEERSGRGLGALARAEILRPEPPLGFVHPLVRDAVYHELPPGERELAARARRARAARRRRAAGAGRRAPADRAAPRRARGSPRSCGGAAAPPCARGAADERGRLPPPRARRAARRRSAAGAAARAGRRRGADERAGAASTCSEAYAPLEDPRAVAAEPLARAPLHLTRRAWSRAERASRRYRPATTTCATGSRRSGSSGVLRGGRRDERAARASGHLPELERTGRRRRQMALLAGLGFVCLDGEPSEVAVAVTRALSTPG